MSRHICLLFGTLIGLISANASGEPKAHSTDGPPELRVAVTVDRRTLEIRHFVKRMVTRTTTSNLPPGVTIKAKAGSIEPASTAEVVPVVEMQTTRVDITKVVGRRVDGRAVPYEVLIDELARPTPVILAKQGEEVDPLFVKIFKPETLVLLFDAQQSAIPDYVAPASGANY